ncbi:YjjG family noncanonical pyrimidine nucleotidase [Psychrobacillus lasiicapitis]|uniref:Noncanonical pyrimidine nucleotidase, YjjG family n=1 Tax=Psychrobacillus lasiicapitis TaxID=1636719 RepID=A0A544SYL3_9BACI|nr:YjjG family noncanonical pyrimidine nucleotidase [Psychrobacillus lasiicapitis]TQR10295.1 noncanonical pyrimidine nucleotidase, YjjG family [Psychrobacillus lasiicapitis]GGA47066.1 noncanonical pyrimidine nucleotidase, YjjG family protein [Psychrobacillus lasiicapitis]
MRYDVLLFDLDDTLFDFGMTEKNALHNLFMEYGLPNGVKDYLPSYKAISKVLWDDLEQGRTTLANIKVERFKQLFLEQALDIDAEVFGHKYIENLGKEVHMIEGVEEMLSNLAGCRFAVLTNGFTIAQHARIGGSSLKDLFEIIITSEEAGYQKPQPEIFEYILDKLNVTDKSRVLMIGDSLSSDIQGGNNFGIDTCWFNPHVKNNTTAIHPTYEIQTWDRLVEILKKQVQCR